MCDTAILSEWTDASNDNNLCSVPAAKRGAWWTAFGQAHLEHGQSLCGGHTVQRPQTGWPFRQISVISIRISVSTKETRFESLATGLALSHGHGSALLYHASVMPRWWLRPPSSRCDWAQVNTSCRPLLDNGPSAAVTLSRSYHCQAQRWMNYGLTFDYWYLQQY